MRDFACERMGVAVRFGDGRWRMKNSWVEASFMRGGRRKERRDDYEFR